MQPLEPTGTRVALLLAKSVITGAADTEMARLAEQLQAGGQVDRVLYAYSEQGVPSLREVFTALADSDVAELLLLPLLLPMEPGFTLWIKRSVQRWRAAQPHRRWPLVRLAPAPARSPGLQDALTELLRAAMLAPPVVDVLEPAPEGSTVPAQQWRVLVCQGAPCNNLGAAVVWGHLRNEQKRLDLRTSGPGVMTCKTSCLGPCNLGPVLQVFPGGTYYGGVDEAGIDRIVAEHLQGGVVVSTLAYAPAAGKQRLRSPASKTTPSPYPRTLKELA